MDYERYPVIVVDDEPDNLAAFRFSFRKSFCLCPAGSAAEALELLERTDAAVIVTDQRMPGMTGLALLERAAELRPDAVGIIISAYTDAEVLIEAVNLGKVYRYITKPWDTRDLSAVIRQAIERFHLGRDNRRLTDQLRQYAGYLDYEAHRAHEFGEIVGASPALAELLDKVSQVAPTNSTVLLRGETGTGKEMVARAIHLNSGRAERPFVAVNCGALPTELLESELFGHERGAFTNAINRRKGRFELADGGTLFLDEVGDLSQAVQVKLLRALQEREFERLGGTSTVKVDVRVISATNRDLHALVEQGSFREDLYYRLDVFPLELPPLRLRGDDVLLLAGHFIAAFRRDNRRGPTGLTDDANQALLAYCWPGNVRELQNVIERACILCRDERIDAAALDFGPRALAASRASTPASSRTAASLREQLDDQEQSSIADAIERNRGNIAAAARALGINRSTLYFRIKKLGLEHMLPTQPLGETAANDEEKA